MDFSELLKNEISKKKAAVDHALAQSSSFSAKSVKNSDLLLAEQDLHYQELKAKRKHSSSQDIEEDDEEYQRKRRERREQQIKQFQQEKENKKKLQEEKTAISQLPESSLTNAQLVDQLKSRKIEIELSELQPPEKGSKESDSMAHEWARIKAIKKLNKLKKRELINKHLKLENSIPLTIKEEDIKTNKERVSVQMCAIIRTILGEWRAYLETHPHEQNDDDNKTFETTSAQNLNKAEQDANSPAYILKQTVAYFKPLLLALRSNTLSDSQYLKIARILRHIQRHEFHLANSVYIQLSIGNAAWPVGVTAVGIHARSAREKITGEQRRKTAKDSSGNGEVVDDGVDLANIISGEEDTRNWIVAVKRLITFSEAHLSKKKIVREGEEENEEENSSGKDE